MSIYYWFCYGYLMYCYSYQHCSCYYCCYYYQHYHCYLLLQVARHHLNQILLYPQIRHSLDHRDQYAGSTALLSPPHPLRLLQRVKHTCSDNHAQKSAWQHIVAATSGTLRFYADC